ncbi:Piwi domain-containing protein [Thiospirillum jenense]|uniref:Protein argonaute n=1 Tax=Thiospirillum jenense TaxID=1653858 RepID=A0A839H986_9GAMM|nr:Piwi domain-containing protein [Thiospirillum jenense]MBB1125611.1 hypothetical protein [Thiospirillum jenense]
MTLFAELFPVNTNKLPRLFVYQLQTVRGEITKKIGWQLAYRLTNQFKKQHFVWDDDGQVLIADIALEQAEIDAFIKELWQLPIDSFKAALEAMTLAPHLQPSQQGIADFVAHSFLNDIAPHVTKALDQFKRKRENYDVILKADYAGWVVHGQPAISISVSSELQYKHDVKRHAATLSDINQLIGLSVFDKTKWFFKPMKITSIVGQLGEPGRRERLLSFDLMPRMQKCVEEAPDSELVVKLNRQYDYVISALGINIRNKDHGTFNVSERLQIPPKKRAECIKAVVQLIQKIGIIGGAYGVGRGNNSSVFLNATDIGYTPQLLFGNHKSASFGKAFDSIRQFGAYKPAKDKTIRLAIVNTVPNVSLKGLREQLRSLLGEDGLGYKLILTGGPKNIVEPSRAALEIAINDLAGKIPDLILGIIAKPYNTSDEEQWTLYDHFKHLTLDQGLYSQVLQPKNLDNEYVLNNVVLGILAKTGTIPYVLANPIDYADLIVGLDVARRPKQMRAGTINVAASARVYLNTGELLRYSIRNSMLEGEIIPMPVLQDMFPVADFAGKRVIIHRDGRLYEKEQRNLLRWSREIGATFYFVEIIKDGNPRLYGVKEKEIVKAPKGSILTLSDTEAFLISSDIPDKFQATPQPLRIRTDSSLPLAKALHSVLTLTLLHYGSERPPRLPVTTYYADRISSMVLKGLRPNKLDGNIPFWL